jgi:hypothetical protein
MSKIRRATSLLSPLTLTLIGIYMAIDVLLFARQSGGWLSMAAGLPIDLGLVWLCSDGLAPSELKKPPGRSPDGFFRNCCRPEPVPSHSIRQK